MRRLTRGIGLFGGTAATMTAKRIKLPSAKTENNRPDEPKDAAAKPEEPTPAERSWLGRLFGSDDDEPQK
jgi:hypothetical protein